MAVRTRVGQVRHRRSLAAQAKRLGIGTGALKWRLKNWPRAAVFSTRRWQHARSTGPKKGQVELLAQFSRRKWQPSVGAHAKNEAYWKTRDLVRRGWLEKRRRKAPELIVEYRLTQEGVAVLRESRHPLPGRTLSN